MSNKSDAQPAAFDPADNKAVVIPAVPPVVAPAGLAGLDNLLQHRSRLGAMVLLSTAAALSFKQLRTLLNETDGNLGAQLRKLEESNYLIAEKAFVERKPTTTYQISAIGLKALKLHLHAMSAIVAAAADAK